MSKIIDADVIKRKLIAYGFSSLRMTVTELIYECEELPTMQTNAMCCYCKNSIDGCTKDCDDFEMFVGKKVIEVE